MATLPMTLLALLREVRGSSRVPVRETGDDTGGGEPARGGCPVRASSGYDRRHGGGKGVHPPPPRAGGAPGRRALGARQARRRALPPQSSGRGVPLGAGTGSLRLREGGVLDPGRGG